MCTHTLQFTPRPVASYMADVWLLHNSQRVQLGNVYHELLTRCSFEEFYQAYESCSLVQLFNSKNINLQRFGPHLTGFLADAPHVNKSVWNLKQFVVAHESNGLPVPSVQADYRFSNCRNEEEVLQLKDIYKKIFEDDN